MDDPAAKVNHYAQVNGLTLAKSFVESGSSPPHFICSLTVGDHGTTGHGTTGHGATKKNAYRDACTRLLEDIDFGSKSLKENIDYGFAPGTSESDKAIDKASDEWPTLYLVDGDNCAKEITALHAAGYPVSHVVVFGSKMATFETYDYTFYPAHTSVKDAADAQLIIYLAAILTQGYEGAIVILSRDAVFEEVAATFECVTHRACFA